jgi:hypothetical protein
MKETENKNEKQNENPIYIYIYIYIYDLAKEPISQLRTDSRGSIQSKQKVEANNIFKKYLM